MVGSLVEEDIVEEDESKLYILQASNICKFKMDGKSTIAYL